MPLSSLFCFFVGFSFDLTLSLPLATWVDLMPMPLHATIVDRSPSLPLATSVAPCFERLYSSASDTENKQRKSNIQHTPKYHRYARLSSGHLYAAYRISCKKCITITKAANVTAGTGQACITSYCKTRICLTRNVSHLSGDITLGNLKLNIDWHSVTVCIKQFYLLSDFPGIN